MDEAQVKAAAACVSQTADTRPELAARWVASIADENQRFQQIETIARHWLKTDRLSVQAWLQRTALPVERIQLLLAEPAE